MAVRSRADVSGNRGQLSAEPRACQAIFSSPDRIRPDFAGHCRCLASFQFERARSPSPLAGEGGARSATDEGAAPDWAQKAALPRSARPLIRPLLTQGAPSPARGEGRAPFRPPLPGQSYEGAYSERKDEQARRKGRDLYRLVLSCNARLCCRAALQALGRPLRSARSAGKALLAGVALLRSPSPTCTCVDPNNQHCLRSCTGVGAAEHHQSKPRPLQKSRKTHQRF